MFQFERLSPKQFSPPAGQGGDLGVIVGGNGFEILDGRDHFGGNSVTFAHMAQEHPQKFDRRAIAAIAPFPVKFWEGLGVAGEAAFDRRHNIGARA